MRTLVTVCVVLGALFWAVPRFVMPWLNGKQGLTFPWDKREPSAADCATDALYEENCVKLNLQMELSDSKNLIEASYVYLRGTVRNLGDRPLSNVILRVRRQAGTSGPETTATHRLGPLGAKETRTIDEMFESIVGEESTSGNEQITTTRVQFTYRFLIELDRVVFAD